jgi:hypothetical protein
LTLPGFQPTICRDPRPSAFAAVLQRERLSLDSQPILRYSWIGRNGWLDEDQWPKTLGDKKDRMGNATYDDPQLKVRLVDIQKLGVMINVPIACYLDKNDPLIDCIYLNIGIRLK